MAVLHQLVDGTVTLTLPIAITIHIQVYISITIRFTSSSSTSTLDTASNGSSDGGGTVGVVYTNKPRRKEWG